MLRRRARRRPSAGWSPDGSCWPGAPRRPIRSASASMCAPACRISVRFRSRSGS